MEKLTKTLMKKNLILSILLSFCISIKANVDYKFIVFGHAYSVLKTEKLRSEFIESINAEKPDFVFILGDSQQGNKGIVDQYRNEIEGEVFFAPGNHDLTEQQIPSYKNVVGYLDTVIQKGSVNFVILNSSESVNPINKFLERAVNKIDTSKINFLFSHFRIWDDNILSSSKYDHDKSYFFEELTNDIYAFDYIFAGNSSAQYFGVRNQTDRPNFNVSHWLDLVNGLNCYSVGMKWKPNFTLVQIEDGNINVMAKDAILSIPFETPLKFSKNYKPPVKEASSFFIRVFRALPKYIYFFAGIVTCLLFMVIRKKYSNNQK
jgi:hypothetical protein